MNDCLRNSTLLSWVAGNDVLLLARVYEKVLDAGEVTDLPFDLSACDDISVTATNGYKTEVLEWAVAQELTELDAYDSSDAVNGFDVVATVIGRNADDICQYDKSQLCAIADFRRNATGRKLVLDFYRAYRVQRDPRLASAPQQRPRQQHH